MNRSQTIATLYKLSFQSPQGHNLRQACLMAMGKIRLANEQDKVETIVEDLENAPKNVQDETKLNIVSELAIKTIEEETKRLAPKGLNLIKAWIKKHSVQIKDIQNKAFAIATSPIDAVSIAFDVIQFNLNKKKDGGDLVGTIGFIASVLSADSPEDLVESESKEWEKFKPYLPAFLGLGAAAVDEHWIHIQKYVLKYGYETMTAVKMWIKGASWLKIVGTVAGSFTIILALCVLFGTHNIYMLLKKIATLVFGLPLAILNDAISVLRWGFSEIKSFFNNAGKKVQDWWDEEEGEIVKKTANRIVLREFKKLALHDERFYRLANKSFGL
jgi:hypothetical protein